MSRALTVAAFGVALAVALTSRPAPPPAEAQVRLVAGTLSTWNSRDGAAILTAAGMAPGDSRVGEVTIANTGDLTGAFSLSRSNLGDSPGPAGGALSTALELLAEDVTNPGAPATVYSGKLGAMGPRELGSWAPGASRTYRFTVSLPDGGAPASGTSGDNAYQSSAVSVQYTWTATADERPAPRPTTADVPPAPAPGAAPELTLTGAKRQRLLRQRGLIVFARCSVACSTSARANGARKVKLSPWSGQMKAGSRVKIKLNLPRTALRSAKRALGGRKRTAMTITARATVGAGQSIVRRLKVSLR